MKISIAIVSLPLFNALAIEWLIVLRSLAGCIGLTVLAAGVLLMPVALYIYLLIYMLMPAAA
jgi:hypothetical protein